MASSNIKLFDENKGNMLTDTEFNISTQRLNGLQTGVASSQLQNKAMYQVSLVAYAIAQVMMQNGLNANDTDAVSAFVANLSGTMLQKVYDIATTAEAQAGVATGKWMSPALTKAFFDYRKANTSEAQNATDDTKWMSPALVRAAFNYIKATTAEAQAGTNDTKWMSPALVKAAMDKYTAGKWLPLAGGTMTGNLILNTSSPASALQAASKGYVDKENSMFYKRHKLFTVTKNYNNVTSGSAAIDKIFTFPNLTLNNLGFLPQRLLIEFSSQNYMATSAFDIRLAPTSDGYKKITSLDPPLCRTSNVRIQNISLNLIAYLTSYFNVVNDQNNINFNYVSVMMPDSSNSNFNFTSEYSFYIYHYNIDGTITVSAYLS